MVTNTERVTRGIYFAGRFCSECRAEDSTDQTDADRYKDHAYRAIVEVGINGTSEQFELAKKFLKDCLQGECKGAEKALERLEETCDKE